MARPRTPIGSAGDFNIALVVRDENTKRYRLRAHGDRDDLPTVWRARARYRFTDGKYRQVERFASTKAKAQTALKEALASIDTTHGGTLATSTSLSVLAQRFLAAKKDAGRAAGTLETYAFAVTAHITPKIGQLSAAEATPERLQAFLTKVEHEHGPGAAKNCRSVLSGMLGLAVRNGAIQRNPVRELERITHRRSKGATAIPISELPTFIEKIRADPYLSEWDTADLIEWMLMVGWRVAEACALEWRSVDLDAKTARVDAIAKRLKGQGVKRQEFPKTDASARVTPLPSEAVALLERRREKIGDRSTLVFPTPLMRLRDPSNTQREIRDRRDAIGYPALSTHAFRKTVATILDEAGLSARDIADYLGHANPSVTQDVYMARQTGSRKAAQAMHDKLKTAI
jgi:integrase